MTIYRSVKNPLPRDQWRRCEVCSGTGKNSYGVRCTEPGCEEGEIRYGERRVSARSAVAARSAARAKAAAQRRTEAPPARADAGAPAAPVSRADARERLMGSRDSDEEEVI